MISDMNTYNIKLLGKNVEFLIQVSIQCLVIFSRNMLAQIRFFHLNLEISDYAHYFLHLVIASFISRYFQYALELLSYSYVLVVLKTVAHCLSFFDLSVSSLYYLQVDHFYYLILKTFLECGNRK